MFTYEGPVAAARDLRAFMRVHGNKLKTALAEKLDAAVDEISPVATCVVGMERVFSALTEVDGEGELITGVAPAAAREASLKTLGVLATAVGHGQYYSKGDRAWLIAAWAAHQLNASGDAPPVPNVDREYAFSEPVVPEPVAPPVSPQA